MATAMFHQCIGTIQLNSCGDEWGSRKKFGNYSLKFMLKGFAIDVKLLTKGSFVSSRSKFHFAPASSSHSSVVAPVSCISHSANDYQKNLSG